jgi:hypothetical protein
VIRVIRRAKNKSRIRNGAWALVAALLPTTECLASDAATAAAAGTESSPPATTTGAPARPKIPPPRIWAGLFGSQTADRPKIPPPRQFMNDSVPVTAQPPSIAQSEPSPAHPSATPAPIAPPAPLNLEFVESGPVVNAAPVAAPEVKEVRDENQQVRQAPVPEAAPRAAQVTTPVRDEVKWEAPDSNPAQAPVAVSPYAHEADAEAAAAISVLGASLQPAPSAIEAPVAAPHSGSVPVTAGAPAQSTAATAPSASTPAANPAPEQTAPVALAAPVSSAPAANPAPVPSSPAASPAPTTRTFEASSAPAPTTPATNPATAPSTPVVNPAPAAGAPAVNSESAPPAPEQAAAPGQGGAAVAGQGGAAAPEQGGVDLAQMMSRAQASGPAPASNPWAVQTKGDSQVEQTACATCGGFHSHADGPALHDSMSCGGGSCIPGRKPCYPPCNECNTVVGAFIQNLYECLCCPDPCYQPTWVPAANASFFADYARPWTVTRIRYDNLEAMTTPDRNQFWIKQVKLARANNNRTFTNPRARLQQVYLYQEAAGEHGSFFIEYPYRQINQNYAPTQAGFGDLNFGIKSLLFDCEMLQVAFQFRTYTPTGNALNNLGTGHFSLDPSILTSLKLGPSTYFQGQFGNWIPLAGQPVLAGGVFYWLMSLNQTLFYCTPDSPLIATLEMDGWSFEDGAYTHAIPAGSTSASAVGKGLIEKGGGVSYFNIGPGLRQSICNRLDIGGAITWSTSSLHWAQPWFRFEVRFLF